MKATEYQLESFSRTLLDVIKRDLEAKEKSAPASYQDQSTQSITCDRSHFITERKTI